MKNAIVSALKEGTEKLGTALTDGAGKAVHKLYSDTGDGVKKVVENTTRTDAEHAGILRNLGRDEEKAPAPHLPGEGEGGGHKGKGGGGSPDEEFDPNPGWHGRSAGQMKHHRLPAVDVKGLSEEEKLATLRGESKKLADSALKDKSVPPSKVEPPLGQHKLDSGCAGSFEHEGVITAHTSTTKRAGQKAPKAHPMVQKVLDDIKSDAENPDNPEVTAVGVGHGKCAEVSLISDRLHKLDPTGTRITTVEQAKEALSGGIMHTRKIADLTDRHTDPPTLLEAHGAYKLPCDTCKHLLPRLGIHPHAGD